MSNSSYEADRGEDVELQRYSCSNHRGRELPMHRCRQTDRLVSIHMQET